MASNRDRAAEVVRKAYREAFFQAENQMDWAPLAAAALDDDGLIAPNPPAPSRTMFPGGQVWHIEEGPVGDVRATSTGEVVAFGKWQEQPFRIVATPEKMRTLARTLEAAADHAEKAAAHVDETLGDTDEDSA